MSDDDGFPGDGERGGRVSPATARPGHDFDEAGEAVLRKFGRLPARSRARVEGVARTTFRAVTPGAPCPVCGGDHKCGVGEDGLIFCGRESGMVEGFEHLGPARKDPQFHLYRGPGGRPGTPNTPPGEPTAEGPVIDWEALSAAFRAGLTPAMARALAADLGLPDEGLPGLGVGYDPAEGCWTCPEKDAEGAVIGINRRYRDGAKRMIAGGTRGLYLPEGWEDAEGPILLPEGFSDAATLDAMGLAAVGRPSCTGGVELLVDLLRRVSGDRAILVLGEDDRKPDGGWPGREGAVATASRLAEALGRPVGYALPPGGAKDIRAWFGGQDPDLDDPEGLDELGAGLVAALLAGSTEVAPWGPILNLDDPDLPTFPTASLAEWQRRYVESIAMATQTPVDLAAMLTLAVTALAVAGRVVLEVRPGYREPLNIYAMIAQPPASRKTSVFREVAAPVEEFEREQAIGARPLVAEARCLMEIRQRVLEDLQKKAAKAPTAERASMIEEARAAADELAGTAVPEVVRLLVDDATPEKLANLMAAHGGRIALMSPEGGVFEMMGGRYSSSGAANLGIYLKAHAGDTLRVDRMNRPPEFIDRPALTMGLAVQPDVIRGLAQDPKFRGRGLLGRILFSLPRSLVGHREVDAPPVTESTRNSYHTRVRALLAISAGVGPAGEPAEHVAVLSAEAYGLWLGFAGWLEPRLADSGEIGHVSDWAGKLAGAVARLVGLLHLADHALAAEPWSTPIPAATMARAIAIGRYLISHALAAFAEMGCDPTVDDARYLLRWIRRRGGEDFTRHDAFEATRGHFRRVEAMEPALRLLEAHNYTRSRPTPPRAGPGRPKGLTYAVNPAALGGSPGPVVSSRAVTDVEAADPPRESPGFAAPRAPATTDGFPSVAPVEYEEGLVR